MVEHVLKIWPKYYKRVAEGAKNFELRLNDRDYQVGDMVWLNEWCPEKKMHTASVTLKFKIGYVFRLDLENNEDYHHVIFSLLPVENG